MAEKSTHTDAPPAGVPPKPTSAVVECLSQWLSGLLIGLFLALATTFAADSFVVSRLSAWGTDVGMQILANPETVPDRKYLKTDNPFVFLDLDPSACRAYYRNKADQANCSDASYPPAGLLAALVHAFSTAGPRVIALDFPMYARSGSSWEPGEERVATFFDTIDLVNGPPVILPADLLADVVPAGARLRQPVNGSFEYVNGRVRRASFETWQDPKIGDGIVRGFPSEIDVLTDPPAKQPLVLPSAPYLISMIVKGDGESGLAEADRLYYDAFVNANSSASGLHRTMLLDSYGRFVFSIKPLAPSSGSPQGADAVLRSHYRGSGTIEGGMLYRHMRLSDLLVDDADDPLVRIREELNFDDQIVVIGTSATAALDRHATPLGQMSGSELIINAARAHIDLAAPDQDAPVREKLLNELILLGFAGVSMIVALALSTAVKTTRSPSFPARIGRIVLPQVLFLLGVVAAVLAVVTWTYSVALANEVHVAVDFLLPIFAVALGGFVDMAKRLVDAIEGRITSLLLKIF